MHPNHEILLNAFNSIKKKYIFILLHIQSVNDKSPNKIDEKTNISSHRSYSFYTRYFPSKKHFLNKK